MSRHLPPGQPLLTFPEADKSPLSIRAKALVFVDPRSRKLRGEVERLAPAGLPVLIRGESGTGKELLARQIHRESGRSGLFVAVSCGALSPTWAEAELFGHAVGAYVGSACSRAGWFGSANGGTLYLDEIGDLPQNLQDKLLAALETREVQRLGAPQPTPVDVRLVAASSVDLAQAVAAGKFSERLYRYLDEGCLELPALRERPGDILPLAEYFLGVYAQRLGLPLPQLGAGAQLALERHPWPGNTRELESVIHFALLVCSGDEILPAHLNLPSSAAPLAVIEEQLARLDARELASLQALLAQAGV
ncbi:sigma 54-interacting transcriptional regulator [Azotobacter beijerinckii]|uniref:Sigma-54 interaction domain-containing protein n=1 Tax=Azotobacter beijerinckii TaxID=170623 RepID=A0A1I4F7L6_9GAMM|nr:sigma 54-interacting transcriptional regulator [Azotobacter beijerinckii]SFB57178.1 Sigma-54 interaction domain-containing protein [Azotobacter beijerinckii]SFL13894.1 Sigma-54 interaction domain-containing protein [Azotobacter beijerinckii]